MSSRPSSPARVAAVSSMRAQTWSSSVICYDFETGARFSASRFMRCFCVTLLLGLVAFSAFGQKPNTKPVRPKPAPTPVKKLNEQAEWDKAVALTDAPARIAAFKKFLKNFPKSTHLGEATTQLVTTEYSYANDKLIAGEVDDAADLFTAAVGDAPKPIPDQMWSDQLSKIAANLYFRGARGEALDITKL